MAAIFGVLLGRGTVEVLCYLLQTRPNEELFMYAAVAGATASLLVGFCAGYYPAFKASRMEVVTAIRYE